LAALPSAFAQDELVRTTRDGVYTVEQAEQGQETYKQACAACHPLDWYKTGVMKSWEGGTLLALYDSIATTMPPSNPGSLKRREYVTLLAYILALNEMPTGGEGLPESPEALGKILIKWRNKP
jgi:mono/diheme cytochrome c family protein